MRSPRSSFCLNTATALGGTGHPGWYSCLSHGINARDQSKILVCSVIDLHPSFSHNMDPNFFDYPASFRASLPPPTAIPHSPTPLEPTPSFSHPSWLLLSGMNGGRCRRRGTAPNFRSSLVEKVPIPARCPLCVALFLSLEPRYFPRRLPSGSL